MKKYEEYKITLTLSVEQVNQLSGLTRLYNDRMVSEGYNGSYTECSYLQQLLSFRLDEFLSAELDHERGLKDRRATHTRNPSPEEATPEEAGTVSNGEEEVPARIN